MGMTNNLERRMYEHKNHMVKGFTQAYDVTRLVYYEETNDVNIAIQREKTLKRWNRDWRIALIEKDNPDWNEIVLRV